MFVLRGTTEFLFFTDTLYMYVSEIEKNEQKNAFTSYVRLSNISMV